MQRYDLHTLQLLASIAECRSLAQASRRVGLTASAVSKRIAELEYQVGTPVLIRKTGGVELTLAGKTIVAFARDVMARASEMSQELAHAAQGRSGEVTVMCNTTALLLGLANDLMAFRSNHPKIKVRLHEGMSPEVIDAVQDGRVDLGICSREVASRGLTTHAYRETRLVVAMHASHPLSRRRRLGYRDTLSYPHIGRAPGSALTFVPVGDNMIQAVTNDILTAVKSFDAVLELAAAKIGVGVLPEVALRRGAVPGVIGVPLSDSWAKFRLGIVHDANSTRNPAAMVLLRWLREAVASNRT